MVFWFLLTFAPLVCCLAMVRVRTGSRLHFGLLNVPSNETAEAAKAGARHFGGVGMMVATPGVSLVSEMASAWSAEGPLAERALSFARRLAQALPRASIPPQHLTIEACAPEHQGLGTGTQLGLAVARAVTVAAGLGHLTPVELARLVGRGRRSALGIHGFAHGGLLVEAGKRRPDDISPLVANLPVPESWRVVLVQPPGEQGLHGAREMHAFAVLGQANFMSETDMVLSRIVLLQLLPSLVEEDLNAFGEALHEFNLRVGLMFAPAQGGCYSHPRTQEIIALVRQEGARGAGQSSWGPTIFAFVADEERAIALAGKIQSRLGLPSLVTAPLNTGALVDSLLNQQGRKIVETATNRSQA
jgi:beta-ribofuranosylaminobenzene 5'-phosphate synthase